MGEQEGTMLESALSRYAQSQRDADSLRVRFETEDIKGQISTFLLGKVVQDVWDETTKTPKRDTSIGGLS